MSRTTLSNEPATALRAALACPYPELRDAATAIIRRALAIANTLPEAAAQLGISRQTMTRLRAEYPELKEPDTRKKVA